MKLKPEYIFIWPILMVIGTFFVDWTEYTWPVTIAIHIGIPVFIYFILKRRERKKK